MEKLARQNLKNYIKELADIPHQEWSLFENLLQFTHIPRKQFFLTFGDSVQQIAFVSQGLLKIIYSGDNEYVREFCAEKSFACSYSSLFHANVPQVGIVALEDSYLLKLNYSEFAELFDRAPSLERLARRIAEKQLVKQEERACLYATSSAQTKLEFFFKTYPNLQGRLSDKDIAAYLGMSPVTMSRVKNSVTAELNY